MAKKSENKLDSELHLPRRADGSPDRSEIRIAERRIRQAIGGVICRVEDLPSDLQPSSFAHVKVLHQRSIDVEKARPQQGVPSEIAEAIRSVSVLRHSKRGRIEPSLGAGTDHAAIANQVRPPLDGTSHAEPSDRVDADVEVRSGLHRHDS